MKRNNDDMQRLDVDLLEDLVEATGNIIHDREAKAALAKLPTNQLGYHTLDSVTKWWKERQRLRRTPPTPPWRSRLQKVLQTISKPWELLEYLKDETHRQVQINKKEEVRAGCEERRDELTRTREPGNTTCKTSARR